MSAPRRLGSVHRVHVLLGAHHARSPDPQRPPQLEQPVDAGHREVPQRRMRQVAVEEAPERLGQPPNDAAGGGHPRGARHRAQRRWATADMTQARSRTADCRPQPWRLLGVGGLDVQSLAPQVCSPSSRVLVRPPPARAASGPCVPEYPNGAQCTVWKGKVRYVDDGDTLDADVPGDGLGGLLRVRIIGIQAMERPPIAPRQRAGDCHARRRDQPARAAGQALQEARSASRRCTRRAARAAAGCARSPSGSGGRWRDVGRIMVARGPRAVVAGQRGGRPNVRYSVLTQHAAAAHKGLFSANHCGIGPNEGHPIKL